MIFYIDVIFIKFNGIIKTIESLENDHFTLECKTVLALHSNVQFLCELLLMHYYSNTKMCVKQTFIPYFISSHQQLNTQRVSASKNIIPPNLQQRTPFLFECTCKMDLHYLFESKQSRISTS